MTDANTDTQAQPEKTTEQNVNTQTDQTVSTDLNIDLDAEVNAEQKTVDASVQTTETPAPAMKKVDIVIAGVTYQIYCPVNEEEELRSAVYYINNFVLDIKQDAPNLPQENLLVLCCLNLFEKINSQQKNDESRRYDAEKSELLLNKIVLDAQSIL
ncbi:cell division protein ZapA [Psychrobacter urativorans]|uniref:Uncharacterized protein n=1 Tax=Psychrobacter urativorans TaxID=45610 RepID=A0A0M5MK06_9GAMM|nr:cell division protein ZapA [Psychrobacter urativorans]ALF59380.1 hypothetical protein AOC03_04360 [Psychrobacter urativorans]